MDLNYFNDAIIIVYQFVGLFPTKIKKINRFYDDYIQKRDAGCS